MRKSATVVVLALGISSHAAAQSPARPTLCSSAPVAVQNGFFSGSDMTRMSAVEMRTLIAGFVNGVTAAPLLGAGDDCVRRIVRGCFVNRELDQLEAVVRTYLASSPAEWHEGSNTILYRSLIVQCVQRS